MKFPIGIQSFEKIRNDGFVYVDKTDLVYELVNEGKTYFLSRPRRFGKSLLMSTLKCYFEGKKALFDGLRIAALEKEWKHYTVLSIDFNGNNFADATALIDTLDDYITSWENEWGKSPSAKTLGDRFAYVLHQVHEKTGLRCVVLVDEYDKPLLDVIDTNLRTRVGENEMTIEDYNRNVLKGFYSVFKKADDDLQFVMLTGVTKFSQVSVFSGFNQPNDISMLSKYDALCGITEAELLSVFKEPIAELAARQHRTAEQVADQLKGMYDGYHFSEGMVDIYNPYSLLKALNNQKIDSYWFQSGTRTYLIRLLKHTNENLNELTGKYYDATQFVDYKADVEKPLPMIYQSGYFTIKDYRWDDQTFLLDLPNKEVKKGLLTLVAASYFTPKEDTTSWLIQTQRSLKDGDTEQFRKLLTSFLASIPYEARRKENETEKERYFQYTVYLLMRMISCYTVYFEKEQSRGRVDSVVETNDYVYIFEYKLDRPAAEAIAQIDEKGYAKEYALDHRKVLKIGCTFSSETGTVSDWLCQEA